MRPPIDDFTARDDPRCRGVAAPTGGAHHLRNDEEQQEGRSDHDDDDSERGVPPASPSAPRRRSCRPSKDDSREEKPCLASLRKGERRPLRKRSIAGCAGDVDLDGDDGASSPSSASALAQSLPNDDERHDRHPRRRAGSRHSRVQRRPTRGPIQNPVEASAIACGIVAGVAQAGLFNPYDRALYLSVKNGRPFLARPNWTSPYTGFGQSLGNRALAGGLYYPLEHYFLRRLNRPNEIASGPNWAAGAMAGACNAVVLNPITVVKYRTWGYEAAASSSSAAAASTADSARRGGWFREAWYVVNSAKSLRPFYNGLTSTLMRDVTFGGVYTGCRLQIQWCANLSPDRQWQGNVVSAGLATILASPFNYVRNVQYATSSRQLQPRTAHVLRELARHVVRESDGSWLKRLRILQVQLRVGWGTLRVALGMSFAHAVYDELQRQIRPYT